MRGLRWMQGKSSHAYVNSLRSIAGGVVCRVCAGCVGCRASAAASLGGTQTRAPWGYGVRGAGEETNAGFEGRHGLCDNTVGPYKGQIVQYYSGP